MNESSGPTIFDYCEQTHAIVKDLVATVGDQTQALREQRNVLLAKCQMYVAMIKEIANTLEELQHRIPQALAIIDGDIAVIDVALKKLVSLTKQYGPIARRDLETTTANLL